MAHNYPFRAIIERATSKAYSESTVARVLGELPDLGAHAWLGGGAIRRTLLNEEPDSDFDLFFRSENDLTEYGNALSYRGFKPGASTGLVSNYTGPVAGAERKVQLIRMGYYNGPVQVLESFDYTICQFVTDGIDLYVGDYSLWDLARKRLVVNKITYPVASLRRLLKYTKQGFYACDGTLRDLLLAGRDESLDLNTNYVD